MDGTPGVCRLATRTVAGQLFCHRQDLCGEKRLRLTFLEGFQGLTRFKKILRTGHVVRKNSVVERLVGSNSEVVHLGRNDFGVDQLMTSRSDAFCLVCSHSVTLSERFRDGPPRDEPFRGGSHSKEGFWDGLRSLQLFFGLPHSEERFPRFTTPTDSATP